MQFKKPKKVVYFLFLLIGFFPLLANNPSNFGHFTNENGLSNNSITFIFQDRNKFIWIGTSDGLNLYNGYNFRIFRSIRGDSTSLPDNEISTIFQDSYNNLWFGTVRGGLCRYNSATDAFIRIKTGDSGITNNTITGITEDRFHQLWVSTNWGLNRYNLISGKIDRFFATYPFPALKALITKDRQKFPLNFPEKLDSLSHFRKGISKNVLFNFCEKQYGLMVAGHIISNVVQSLGKYQTNLLLDSDIKTICNSENGDIWIGYENEGFSCIHPDKASFEHYSILDRNRIKLITYGVNRLISVQNELYIGYNNGKSEIFNCSTKKFQTTGNLLFSSRIVNFQLYGNQKILIASEKVIYTMDVRDKSTNIFLNHEELEDKDKEKAISFIFIDAQDNRWVGTSLVGLFLINKPKGFHRINKYNALSKSSVTSITQDDKNNFWVGYSPEGLDQFSPNWDLLNHYTFHQKNSVNSFSKPVLVVYQDKSDSLWVCSYQNGIFRFNPKSKVFISHFFESNADNGLQSNDIRALIDDNQGNIWFATQGAGLGKYNKKTANLQLFKADYGQWQQNLPSDWLFDIKMDKLGLLWIGTSDGLTLYNPSKSKFKTYKRSNSLLANDFINTIFIDSNDNIWIGTKGGLSIYDKKSDKFSNITVEDGIANNDIKSILEANDHTFWISTNGGLFSIKAYRKNKFDPLLLHGSIFKFDVYDGLSSNEFFNKSCAKDNFGNLYFGGNQGITFFHPDSIQLNQNVPDIFFTGLKLFNNPVLVNQKYGKNILLKKAMSATDTIFLDYQQNMLTFEFVALNYIEPQKNQYKYRLSGFDSTWVNLGNRNEITYTNLQSGIYTLTVKGSNNDGYWNNKGKSLTIIIKPPFWNAIWFRIVSILLLILLIIGAYYLRIASIRKINRDLRVAVIGRTRELVEKNRALMDQAEELNSTNTLLEKQKRQIEIQKEKLTFQRDELSQLNITKDKLFSILAHDLRNPFNSIIGFSELLLNELGGLDKKQIAFYADIIYTSSVNGNDLLENLLQWTAAQTERISFEPERFNISEVLDDTIALFTGNIHRKNIMVTSLKERNVIVHADRNMVKTILRNLISNAIKFTPQDGKIEISSIMHQESIEIIITDTGVGIPAKSLEELFKLESTISTKGTANEPGTGLGLLLCKEFVEIHQCKIWANSIIDKGSSFHFTLPIS